MADGEAEWELCKENIQPLRHGRAISVLHQALCRQQDGSSTALHQQKQAFESELRMYTGDDPLDVWYRYIKWTEQTYPQGGKDSSLTILLERAVMKFTEEKRYHNDVRYIDLWIRFAEGCSDPLDIYRYMQAQGIGTMQASFYIAWSEEYEKRGNAWMADSIFQDGLKCGAEPLDRLQQFHKQPLGAGQNSQLMIFDENKECLEPQEPKIERWMAPPTAKAKENEQKPDKWTNVKKSRFGHTTVVPPPKPNFQPFVEENDQPPAVTPCKINPAVNPVLSARKPRQEEQTPLKRLQEHMQLQQEDEAQGREKIMYCMDLLYSGATEFSFEELRAERHRLRQAPRLDAVSSSQSSQTD
uniref:BUB1 N-terminal domain-containing protein n=1 Tax=Electrophorus electricus TaxID=8005 RepID=A0A4W4H1Z7_ELEEL